MPKTPPEHRDDSLPRVRCRVNQIHGSAIRAYCRVGSSRHPIELQKKGRSLGTTGLLYLVRVGVWSKPWVCGKGLQRTAWEPLADLECALHSMRDVLRNVQRRISALTAVPHLREICEPAM